MVVLNRINLLYVKVLFNKTEEWKVVEKSLSFLMPGHEFSSKFIDGYWDGYLRFYNKREKVVPIGLLGYVEKSLSRSGIKVLKRGFGDKGVDWIKFSAKFVGKERDYQRDAISAFLRHRCGIIKIPTRGGKTFVAAETIRLIQKEFGLITVFVTDSSDLFYQVTKDIADILECSQEEIGQIKGESLFIRPVNVAMTQTIQSILKRPEKIDKLFYQKRERRKTLLKLIKDTGVLIVDEIHEYGRSRARQAMLKKFHPEYFMSLTATTEKNDLITNLNILELTGGIVYDISEKMLEDRNVLAKNRVLLLFNDSEDIGNDYRDSFGKFIINNEDRNNSILEFIGICKKLSIKLLILSMSKKHGRLLSEKSGDVFIHGETPMEQRLQEKQRFLEGVGGVLFASWIWKKGITLPEVQVIMNISGGLEQSALLQIRGRGLGVSEGKDLALFVDFIDDFTEYFNDHSLKRIETYEKFIGEDKIDVMDIKSTDFITELEQYLKGFFL